MSKEKITPEQILQSSGYQQVLYFAQRQHLFTLKEQLKILKGFRVNSL